MPYRSSIATSAAEVAAADARGGDVETRVDEQRAATGPARGLAGAVLFVGVLLAVIGVALVVNQLTQPGGVVEVLVDEQILGLDDVEGLPEGTALRIPEGASGTATDGTSAGTVTLALEVAELPMWLRGLTELPWAVSGIATLIGAIVLRRVLLEIAAGRPFAARNPGRLRVLAAVALVVAIVPGVLGSLATVLTLEHLGASGPPLGFRIVELSVSPFFLAAALLVVAEVFKHGRSLTDDVEGLV
jgi:hypothetical protein